MNCPDRSQRVAPPPMTPNQGGSKSVIPASVSMSAAGMAVGDPNSRDDRLSVEQKLLDALRRGRHTVCDQPLPQGSQLRRRWARGPRRWSSDASRAASLVKERPPTGLRGCQIADALELSVARLAPPPVSCAPRGLPQQRPDKVVRTPQGQARGRGRARAFDSWAARVGPRRTAKRNTNTILHCNTRRVCVEL